MKKQVLSLLLAGALTLGLFGCSAQTPEESGVPQSAPAQTEGTDSAGVVEELKIGICKEVTPRTDVYKRQVSWLAARHVLRLLTCETCNGDLQPAPRLQ